MLRTLPPEHLRAGLAEAIKHGVIADAAYFDEVVALGADLNAALSADALTDIVARGIAIKADVVRQDEREAVHGPRRRDAVAELAQTPAVLHGRLRPGVEDSDHAITGV